MGLARSGASMAGPPGRADQLAQELDQVHVALSRAGGADRVPLESREAALASELRSLRQSEAVGAQLSARLAELSAQLEGVVASAGQLVAERRGGRRRPVVAVLRAGVAVQGARRGERHYGGPPLPPGARQLGEFRPGRTSTALGGPSMRGMWKVIKRRWNYLVAKLSGRFEESADPKVQLEQAMAEAQEQHRRLVEQAASVIANQKQTELQLNRSMQELEKISSSTRQALSMADEAARRGDTAKAAEYNQTAEAFANRLIMAEKRVDDLKTMSLQSTQAAQQAKAAVQQNANLLQQKLSERQKLLSQLDQARMQEQLNTAMATLSQTVGQDVPTFDEVRTKIEAQYAKALGTAELSNQGVEARMLEIEQASVNSEAQTRLAEMRSQMGLPPGAGAGGRCARPWQRSGPVCEPAGGQSVGSRRTGGCSAANDQAASGQPAFPGQSIRARQFRASRSRASKWRGRPRRSRRLSDG